MRIRIRDLFDPGSGIRDGKIRIRDPVETSWIHNTDFLLIKLIRIMVLPSLFHHFVLFIFFIPGLFNVHDTADTGPAGVQGGQVQHRVQRSLLRGEDAGKFHYTVGDDLFGVLCSVFVPQWRLNREYCNGITVSSEMFVDL